MKRNLSSLSDAAPLPVEQDPRWTAVVARDTSADGSFVYAVRTTGIYCHPGSPTRLPKPENVVFFDSPEDAEAAGFRASQRANADQTSLVKYHADLIAKACRQIEEAKEKIPRLEELAATAAMSPYHFHRVFKQITGVTPKAYADAHRAQKMRVQLAQSSSITEALYQAGFNSNSRFYENADQLLGMSPSRYRQGGKGIQIHFALGECSLGSILVATSERGICAILLGDDPQVLLNDLQDKFPKADLLGGDQQFEQLVATVVGFVEAPAIGLALPLDLQGTAFQQRVWQALCAIPPGTTASYADIAAAIGAPKAVRAVALACGANSIAVAIPCHRVIRSDGKLSGYRWGIDRKRALLRRESST